MSGLLSKERIIAPPGFNRWLVPPASIAIHLCIGSVYAWSIFNPALIRVFGVVTPAVLRRVRRYAAIGIVALVAVLTPSGDPFTLLVLSVPMLLFYEIAILVGVLRDRRRAG